MSKRENIKYGILRAERIFYGTANGGLGTELSTAELGYLDDVTPGTVEAEKVVVVDENKDIAGFRNIDITGTFTVNGTTMEGTEFAVIDGVTPGTAAANKAVVLDGSADLTSGINDFTVNQLLGPGGTPLLINGNGHYVDIVGAGYLRVGVDDTTVGQIYLYGGGSNDGGVLRIFCGVDLGGGSIQKYNFSTYQDDLIIGPDGDTDSLKYNGGTGVWEFTGAGGVSVTGGPLTIGTSTIAEDGSSHLEITPNASKDVIFTTSSGNVIVSEGNLLIGTNDSVQGWLRVYGANDGTSGGRIDLFYAGAASSAAFNFYRMEIDSDGGFTLSGNGTAKAIQYWKTDGGTGNYAVDLFGWGGNHVLRTMQYHVILGYNTGTWATKLATTATGITVTGSIAADGLTGLSSLAIGDTTYGDGNVTDTGAFDVAAGTNVSLLVNTSESALVATANGAVALYWDDSKTFETKQGGLSIYSTTNRLDLYFSGTTALMHNAVSDANTNFTGYTSAGEGGIITFMAMHSDDGEVEMMFGGTQAVATIAGGIALGSNATCQVWFTGVALYLNNEFNGGRVAIAGESTNGTPVQMMTIESHGSWTFVARNSGDTATNTLMTLDPDGAISLNYIDNTKLATTVTGVTITGVLVSDGLTLGEGDNIVLGTSTGTQIGTAASQMLGFYGATPIIQPTTGVGEAAFVENLGGTAVNDDSTFGGYTLQQIAQALQSLGLLT